MRGTNAGPTIAAATWMVLPQTAQTGSSTQQEPEDSRRPELAKSTLTGLQTKLSEQ